MVAGRRPVAELMRAGRRHVERILAADPDRLPGDLVEACGRAGVPVVRADSSELARISGMSAHQGIVALADPVPLHDLVDVSGEGGFVIVLDEVVDPRNLGAVLRVADATGAVGVVVSARRSAPLSATAVKASAGAIEWVPLVVVGNVAGALSELRDAGRWLVGLDLDGIPLGECDLLGEPVALVAGAEGAGLRPKTRRICDAVATIPMRGRIGSLNVSTAVAIGAFVTAERHTR